MTTDALALAFGVAVFFDVIMLALAALAVNRSLMWRSRYYELMNKPFSFWDERERNRRMWLQAREAVKGLEALDRVAPLPTGNHEVVKFRRPAPFEPKPL
jgi:hypothetical protein